MKNLRKHFLFLTICIVFVALITTSVNSTNLEEMAINSIDGNKENGIIWHDIKTETETFISDEEIASSLGDRASENYSPAIDPINSNEQFDDILFNNTPRSLLGSWSIVSNHTLRLYRSTVYLETRWPNGSISIGTGFMIGPATVATSAHNIYNVNGGGWATVITAVPARYPDRDPYGYAESTSFATASGWMNGNYDYDWGVIRVNKNIGDLTGLAGYATKTGSYDNFRIAINGYPQPKLSYNDRMYVTSGTVKSSYDRTLRSTNTNTTKGMSGSPVYLSATDTNSAPTVIAIHSVSIDPLLSSPYNQHVRITQAVFNVFNDCRSIRV